MSTIRVINGRYRAQSLNGQVFTLVKGFKNGTNGHYITVKNNGVIQGNTAPEVRIVVDKLTDFEFVEGDTVSNAITLQTAAKTMIVQETDEEAMSRIKNRFSILDSMTKACINGDVRAMIVSGPPGVGKSFGVEQQLEKSSLIDKLTDSKLRYEIFKGAISAIGLYCLLYKHSESKNVLVFDDCDSVLDDEIALNILKAALDSGKRRRISWNSDSNMLRREGVPDQFDFKGSCIFITNLNFDANKKKKLSAHLEALQSRCHFLDLTITTERDKLLRIRQVHRDAENTGGLFANYDFEADEAEQIFEFVEKNKSRIKEISLRRCLLIADLIKVDPVNWRNIAESTCMKAL